MFEFHGWATVVLTPASIDIPNEDALRRNVSDEIARYMGQLGWTSGALDIRPVNGQYHVWASGFRNHKDTVTNEVFALFRYIGMIAPGSFGLLYVYDDEDTEGFENSFQVFVLARGLLNRHKDQYLSPVIPTVEDP